MRFQVEEHWKSKNDLRREVDMLEAELASALKRARAAEDALRESRARTKKWKQRAKAAEAAPATDKPVTVTAAAGLTLDDLLKSRPQQDNTGTPTMPLPIWYITGV